MLEPLAIHESGHAVASLLLGIGAIDRVTLDPPATHFTDPDAWLHGGRAGCSRAETKVSGGALWRLAAIRLLAGCLAECKHSGESFQVVFARNSMDRRMVRAFVDGLASDSDERNALLHDLVHESGCLVARHWPAILAVGRALSISHMLLGCEVERLCRRHTQ
jgi:hypothetical protein